MEWEQLALIAPDVIEIRVTIGVVRSGDHLQWQLSITDPTVNALLAMTSAPHRPLTTYGDELDVLVGELRSWIEENVLPF